MSDERLRRAIEKSLRLAWGGDVVLEASDQRRLSEREHVHRFRVRLAPEGAPSSVIAKQPRSRKGEKFDPRSDNHVTTTFFNEWACLQLLTELGTEPSSPRLYCASGDEGFLVMEDFGSGERLDEALLGGDAVRATQTLIALFETLGQMHGATYGKRARFDAILVEHGRGRSQRDEGAPQRRRSAMEDALNRLALRPHHSFWEELTEIGQRAESAELETLVHGDPCPDNCQWVGTRVRLLDFEHGRFAHAFSDGCYPLIHFPTCWCTNRLPEHVVQQALNAYRRELARGVPAARSEEQFEGGMLDASVIWAWTTFASWHMPHVLSRDQQWGLVTVRQRILFRFRLLLEKLERHGGYPGITETTRQSHAVLSREWPDVPEVPLYPAYR